MPGSSFTMVRVAAGLRLAVSAGGPEGGPAVVVLHGLIGHRDNVVRLNRLRRAGCRVVAFDARGHGDSDAPADPGDYSFDALVEDLVAVMDAAEVSEAVLVGASVGAMTALRLALRAPERVAGLVAITPAHDPRLGPAPDDLLRGRIVANALRAGDVDAFVRAEPIRTTNVALAAALRASADKQLARHRDLGAVADAVEVLLASRPIESFEELARLRIPAVVVATRDEMDANHPHAVACAYAAAIPGARLACERPGQIPLAWRSREVSDLVLSVAADGGARFDGARAPLPR